VVRAQVPITSCVVLPDGVQARDTCGSLVNVITAYAFLSEIRAAGDAGVIVTAGRSATEWPSRGSQSGGTCARLRWSAMQSLGPAKRRWLRTASS